MKPVIERIRSELNPHPALGESASFCEPEFAAMKEEKQALIMNAS